MASSGTHTHASSVALIQLAAKNSSVAQGQASCPKMNPGLWKGLYWRASPSHPSLVQAVQTCVSLGDVPLLPYAS